jgi:hypothetical protein
MSIESPLLFVRGAMYVKSIRVERDVDREPLLFVRDVARVNILRVERDIDWEPLALLTIKMCWLIGHSCVRE